MKLHRKLRNPESIVALAFVIVLTISGCSERVNPVIDLNRQPYSISYPLDTMNPATVGPIHNAILSYFFDSVGNITTFNALSASAQASRFYQLMTMFLPDSTNIDTSGLSRIQGLYETELAYGEAGDYASPAWWQNTTDSIITAASLASDEDSSCKALVDTVIYETNGSILTATLSNMQSQWLNKWTTIDGNGTNGTHDYMLGTMISVAVNANSLTGTHVGGSGGPIYETGVLDADLAGAAAGFGAGGNILTRLGNAVITGAVFSILAILGWI